MKKIDTFQTLARGVKSLIAVMLLMLMAVGNLFADEYTVVFSDMYSTTTTFTTTQVINENFSFTADKQSSSNVPAYYPSGSAVRIYSANNGLGGAITLLPGTGLSITGMEITAISDNYAQPIAYSVDGAEAVSLTAGENNVYIISGINASTSMTFYNNANSTGNQLRISQIKILYEASAPAAVAAPTCTPAAGMFYAAQEVTLACATEGATIYYSMDDGATPYLLYNDPINITEAVTLKAFAVLGEDTSAVTAAEYTFPVDANTIAALKATGIPNTIYKLAEDVIVIYQNGDYLFVQDEDAAVVVYGNVAKTYNPGDVIADGFFGKYKIFNNLNELVPVEGAPAFPDGVAGTAVEPIVATVDTVLNNYTTWEAKLVKFENVVFTDATHFAQGEDTLVIYNQFGTSFDITPGSVANVTGLVVKYKSNVQIYPRTNADVEILSVPAAELPYRVDFDEYVDENLVIDNGTYTNKWYVGQAQDFDNNKLYISSSNGRTNKYNTEAPSRVIASRDLNIPANGAIVSFDCRYQGASDDHLRFEIRNAVEHSVLKVESTNNEWQNVTLSIPSEMAGVVTISFVWENNDNGGEQYPAAIDNIYIYESPCSQPAALSTTVDTTSATITWSGDAEAYLLQYKLANHSEWYSVNTNDTTVTLTNLQGNSNYDVRVQSVCEEYASAWTEGHFAVDCQNYITVPEEKIVGTGNSSAYYAPFNNYYHNSWNECIYPASEFNGPATINSISWNCASSAALTFSSLKIYMGTRTSETYSSNSDWTPESALQLVYDGTDVRVGASRGWQEFILNTPFEYNGTDNLVVVVAKKQSSYSSNLKYYYTNVSNTCLYRQIDGNESYADYPGTNTGTLYYRANIKFNMIVSSCGDSILCPDVTDVVVSDITREGATIAWTPGSEDQDNFIVEYMAANEVEWTVADSNISTPTYNLTGLDPFTYYIVRVKANCGDYNMSEAAVSNEFRTKGICDTVTEISHYNLATTVVLTWTRGADETAWIVKFKPKAAEESAWVEIPVQGQATASLGGLQAQTDYDVQILALCEGDTMGLSDWATYSFTSACATVDIPVAYTLKSNDHDCWEATAFDYASNGASTNIPGASLISPAFNIPREGQYFVSFDVEGDYQLLASYRGTRDDRFEVLTSGSDAEGKVIVAIPEEYLGRGVNFKFIYTSESVMSDGYLQVSNFKINACPFEPTNFVVSDYTANTVSLSWTADTTVNNFQVQYGERGFVLGEGTIIDVLGNSTTIDVEYGNDYSFYVRANCGSNGGDWVGPISQKIEFAYIMGEVESITTCIGTLYDNGGPQSYYQSSSNDVMVIYPASENSVVRLQGEYNTESCCDKIYIYDGENTSAHQLGAFGGQGTIDVTSTTGALTVKFTSDVSVQYPGFALNISCEQLPTCGVPTIAVNSSAVATITPKIGEPESYDLAIGEDTVINVAGPTIDLTTIFTLDPNTEYAVSVRANCGDEDGQSFWSDPVSFTTPCGAVAVPYTEDFEDYSSGLPDCWTKIGVGTVAVQTSYVYAGSKSLKFFGSTSNVVALPAFDGENLQIVFYTCPESFTNSSCGQFDVGYVNANNEFTALTTYSYNDFSDNYEKKTVNLSSLPANAKMAFRHRPNSTSWYWFVDNVIVENIPTCGVPTIAVNSSAVATITRNEIGAPESYDLMIGEDTVNVTATTTTTTVDLTTIFTLAPNTEYAVSVRANCGDEDGQSLWSDPVSFTTPCMALSIPYTQDFEGTEFPPQCWTQEYVTGTHNWVRGTSSSYGSGSYDAAFTHENSNEKTKLITPMFDLSSEHSVKLIFKHRQVKWGGDKDVLEVYYRSSSSSNWISLAQYSDVANMTTETIFLPAAALTATCQFAFEATDNYGYGVYVDDVTIDRAPTCITPTDFAVTAADTTAQLTWTDSRHQDGYKVQYRLVGENTWQEVTGITATNCTLRGLQPSSDYEARVLAVCGEGDESEATESVSFTTMCVGGYYEGVSIGEGTSTSSNLPSNINWRYSLTQQIYTAEEMDFTGDLNSVSFYNTSTSATRNLSVYLVHTEKTSFSGTSDWIMVSGSDKVFEGDVTFIQNDWTNIAFDRPFAYNGTSNVVLIVDDNTGSYSGAKSFRAYDAGSKRAFYAYSDNYNGNPTTGSDISSMSTGTGTSLNQVLFNGGRVLNCPPTCPNPTDLAAVNVTANAATITWTAGGSENAWNVEYGKAGFIPGTGTMVEAEDASIELTGLEMGVGYDVYVQANCAADDQSEWVGPANFVTECVTINTLPYTQDFNDFFLPLCWSQNQLGGSEPWGWYYLTDGDPNNWFAGFQNNGYNSADLITPVFDLSSYESVMLTFDRMQLLDYDPYYTDLQLLYRTSDTTEWNLIKEYDDATPVPEEFTWKNEKIILPEEALVANVQFAFRGEGLYYNRTFIDNVVLMETPACYAPTALTLNDVTTTTANISWTAGDSVQTAWNVQYGEHNFTLGEGTIVAVDTTMAELTNLTGGTAYDVYVQSVCDESDSSTWAGPIVIATECVTINTLPYTQDFNDFFLPLCWSQNQLGGSEPWGWYYLTDGDPNNWFAGFQNNGYNSADLITPVFDLSSYESVMLTFDRMQLLDYDSYYTDLKLSYRTSDTTEWNLIKEYDDATPVPEEFTWKNEKIILPEEALVANVQFAFRGEGLFYNRTYIDNVVVMETPCGYVADLAVAQDSMTDTRAYITWKGVAQEYELEYQEVNDENWTVVPFTGNAQWLTNLTPSTNYNVRVKAVCGEEEAEYSEVIDFSTLCLGYYYDEAGNMHCPPLNNDLTVKNISAFRAACEINDPVVVKVTNNAYLDTITSLNLYYVVNDGDTVAETLTLTTPLCFQGETTYTFEELPVFVNGYNNVYAWVEYNDNVYTTNTINVRVIDPIDQYPKYIDLTYANSYDGWNAYDVNEDGITMIIPSSQGVSYTYNDTLDANDWMITPCFYFEPGKYVISYSYNANSVLKESFEFWYGNGAKVADMTTMLGSEEFSGTADNIASYDFDVTEAGVYNFGFWATSLAGNLGFNITNFSIEPVNIVTVTTDGNGVTTPSGDVYVNYDENLTLSIVPNVNYHLSAIYVDSVQVVGEDPYASRFVMYTLENVTEPHDVFVEFKLEFHTHKIVSNYNPAYDQTEGGYFVPAATDTTILVDNHTVFFAPNEHYHFNSLTLSEMDEESPVDFTDSVVYDEATGLYAFTFYNLNVPEYFVNAKFRRDTVNIHYTALTGQGYADASPRMIAGDSVFGEYDTWVDYDLHGDLDTTITITPAGDYHLVNVYVNGQPQNVESDEFHYTFSNVTDTQYVDVNFGYQVTTSIRNYVPTYLGSDEVRGTIAPDTQLVAEGYPTVVTGTVQEHFHLYNLFVDGVDMIDQVVFDDDGQNYSLTIDSTIANYHIEAVVKIDTFGIHYNVMEGQGYADASNLLVAPAHYTTWLNYGDDLMMSLAPDRGYSIGSVMIDDVDMYTASNYFFEYIVDHHDVDVMFVPNNYTITTNAYGQGTVSESMSFIYDPANPVNYEFTANAAEGYHISAIIINDAEIDLTGVTDTYTLTLENVAANYVINAIFEINTYNMFSEASLGGTITPEGLQVVNHGTDLTYEIVADEGRYISSITIDGETTEYTQADNVTNYIELFTSIDADHSVSATFAVKHFTITAEVNEEANHGTIDGVSSFSGEYSYGSNETLNFIPEANYQVSDVVVDGQSVGAVTSYEFVNITAEHNVVVSFAPIQYTLTATSNVDACTITPASTTVQAGSNVNYTLTVAAGYHLVNVIANGEEVNVVANAFTIENVQEDYEIFANFASNYVTVTVEQPEHATITPGTMTYAYGATPSYVIVPEVGYDVTAVHAGNALVNVTYNNGVGSFTLNPVTADITLTATTAIKTFTITATQAAHGTISPAPVQTVNYGGNVTYTITPDDYYEIVDVLVDGASRGALSTYTFNNVTANHTIEAVFEAACMTPSRLTVVYVDTNSATLTWEGNAASYEVRYRAAGETNFTTQTVNTNTITLTGLTENTLYAWGVKANCTATLSSDWAESAFRTHAVIPPYVGISTADLSSIKVYSNLNNVYIVNENGIAIDNVTIYNIFGAQVYSGKANNNPEIISLDVANGNYIVRLSTENGVGVYKLSIVR